MLRIQEFRLVTFLECQNILNRNFNLIKNSKKNSNILFTLFEIAKCLKTPDELIGYYTAHPESWCYKESDWL